ncbi:MAG: peptidoglycan-binding protein [Clostridia bacterium]|nr:peptidoglycan-binding protein [Clostridia bacterium]
MKTLRIGDTGPAVYFLQTALLRAGYLLDGGVDGIFGANTENAVKRFQQENSLVADGVAGERTNTALAPFYSGYVKRRVRTGDTFYKLAGLYGSSVDAIRIANPNVDENNIEVGSSITVPLSFDVVPKNIPFTYEVLLFCVEGLKARYPFLNLTTLGRSVMGKNIPLIKIGNGPNKLMYNASHHANEWITSIVLTAFLEEYSSAVAFNRRIFRVDAKRLFENTTLFLVPMLNPDGVDLATGYLTSGDYYTRAVEISNNYPNISFPTGWKANIEGTDLNLNYPALWERAKAIKFAQGFVTPAPRDYVGSSPFSAPESRLLGELTKNNDFYLTLSYHTQGKIIYWKFADIEVENAEKIVKLYEAVSGYTAEITPESSGYAGYKDWFIQTFRRPGYTIECGRGVNPLPLSQFNDIYEANRGILTVSLLLEQ